MRTKALALGLATLVAASSGNARPLEAQTADYYEQTYLSSSHNWNFRREFERADRLFNAFDFGHSILYETLWSKPEAPPALLEENQFSFITTRLLRSPPNVPLDESAIGPGWSRLVPEVVEMFEWAHMLHRQIYDVCATPGITDGDRDREIARLLAYYKSRPALAFSSLPKHMDLMEGQPYSLAFRRGYPKFNGLIWSYHWLQIALYDALMVAGNAVEAKRNVDRTVRRFGEITSGGTKTLPSAMPMSPAVAPVFSSRYPEAAIIFDNLHSLHDVVSDILADQSIPRNMKRATILRAAGAYRDSTSSVTSITEWKDMAASMGVEAMGGLPPTGGSK